MRCKSRHDGDSGEFGKDLAARSDELTAEARKNRVDAIAKLEAERADALNKRANQVLEDIDDTYDDVVKTLRE